ncbi:MAG: YggT family protein [Rhodospirillaceae bacterium]|nr:YggT family protein [Rhodospirillaceae bacterium]
MNTILIPILQVLSVALNMYWWVVLVAVIMSWLMALNMINAYNQIVRAIWNFVTQLTEPVLRRIRRVVPNVGNVDLSAIVLFLLIILAQQFIAQLIFRLSMG